MAWVNEHNTRSLGVLQGDPRYEGLHEQALALVQAYNTGVAVWRLEPVVIQGQSIAAQR